MHVQRRLIYLFYILQIKLHIYTYFPLNKKIKKPSKKFDGFLIYFLSVKNGNHSLPVRYGFAEEYLISLGYQS